ncbi:MAG: hypothetical protein V4668_03380 [Patescibacteria group bacterium]
MMDAVVDYINRTLRKDSVAVMIQAHDGSQYIVDRNHFVTRAGRTIAHKGHVETIAKAAMRVMRYLDKEVTEKDFEVFKPRNLGPNRTHFVVWFPSSDVFKVDDVAWKQHLFAVEDEHLFTRAQLRAIHFVSSEARKLHEQRQLPVADYHLVMKAG